ncbi:MAG: hypothetical protein QM576_13275 [Rhodopseudomonas sp.]|uniref:hypothetical protein n=1 Tax=Rhodopseudomonas sp. TaxID=1078 RepID=UPI0039E3027B
MILVELAHHHELPAGFDITVIPDGDSFRAMGLIDPAHPEQGELIARAVEIGDQLSHQFSLAKSE